MIPMRRWPWMRISLAAPAINRGRAMDERQEQRTAKQAAAREGRFLIWALVWALIYLAASATIKFWGIL
jgi:hypothetical protein